MRKYGFDEKPRTVLSAQAQIILQSLEERKYVCLVGKNNSGKSFFLKQLYLHLQGKAVYLGPQRYNNFSALSPYSPNKKSRSEWWEDQSRSLRQAKQNIDSSPFNVQQAIAELDNLRRSKLFEVAREILGVELSLELAHPENEMSQRYISCNGHNFSFASSGVRLFISIITSLFDKEFEHFLIDEPELGISPEAQNLLSDFLQDDSYRRKHFPHLKSLILASHSTQFLDRGRISNNFVVKKSGDIIDVAEVKSVTDFNRIHFLLLGNKIESLYLPSVIFFVEGETDRAFIQRSLELQFPDLSFSIIASGGDGRLKDYAHMIAQIFPDFYRSPFRDRIFPILDSIHGKDVPFTLIKKGIPEENIIIWERNGIEYVYPAKILESIFGTSADIEVSGDIISGPGVSLTKSELSARVTPLLSRETEHRPEFKEKLLEVVAKLTTGV